MNKFFRVFGYSALICIAASAFYGRWKLVVGCVEIAAVVYAVVGIPYLFSLRSAKPKEGDIITNKRKITEFPENKNNNEISHDDNTDNATKGTSDDGKTLLTSIRLVDVQSGRKGRAYFKRSNDTSGQEQNLDSSSTSSDDQLVTSLETPEPSDTNKTPSNIPAVRKGAMDMNSNQKSVLIIGILALVLIACFPPWYGIKYKQYEPLGHHFIFDKIEYRNSNGKIYPYRNQKIDIARFLIPLMSVSLLTGGLYICFKDK